MVDPTRGNVSTITVTDYNDGDVFTCRADNDVGFDEESTTINVFSKWAGNYITCVIYIFNNNVTSLLLLLQWFILTTKNYAWTNYTLNLLIILSKGSQYFYILTVFDLIPC